MKENSKSILKKACAVTLTATMLMGGGLTEIGKYIGISISAAAADIVTSGSCGDNVKYTLDSEGTLTISGTGRMKDYGDNNRSPFYQNQNIKKVIIEDGVTSIGDHAFYKCTSLTNIEIPDSVTSIGWDAFYNCTNLTNIEIPDSVTSIGGYACYNCTSLTNIEISDSVTRIGDCTFDGCTSLTKVTIPNSVTSIGNDAFYKCTSLTNIEISDSVTYIGYSAFDETAWYNNQPDGVVYAGKVAYKYKGEMPKNTKITLKDDTVGIAGSAFGDCKNLINIDIPNSVTSIGYAAFWYCTSLTKIKIPSNVTNISGEDVGGAFQGCTSLTDVIIENGVTNIGEFTFCGCTSLTNIKIPDSVTSIGEYAFYECTSLTNIKIPNSVTYIGYVAFDGTAWYDNQPNGVVYAGKVAYKYKGEMPKNTKIILKDDTVGIADRAFYDCKNLINIEIPDSVIIIGGCAFYNTTWYNNQPGGLLYIGKVVYSYKGEMPENTKITLKDGIVEIAGGAFYGCHNLIDIIIPDSVVKIGWNAFDDCRNLKNITIPNSVTSIGEAAFDDCTSLKDVYYTGSEEEWEKIKIDAFNYYLTNATIHYNSEMPKSEEEKKAYLKAHTDFLDNSLYEKITNDWLSYSVSGQIMNFDEYKEIKDNYNVWRLAAGDYFENPYTLVVAQMIYSDETDSIMEELTSISFAKNEREMIDKISEVIDYNGYDFEKKEFKSNLKDYIAGKNVDSATANILQKLLNENSDEVKNILKKYDKIGKGINKFEIGQKILSSVSDVIKYNATVYSYYDSSDEYKSLLKLLQSESYSEYSKTNNNEYLLLYTALDKFISTETEQDVFESVVNEAIKSTDKVLWSVTKKILQKKVTSYVMQNLTKKLGAAEAGQVSSFLMGCVIGRATGILVMDGLFNLSDSANEYISAYYKAQMAELFKGVLKNSADTLKVKQTYENARTFHQALQMYKGMELDTINGLIKWYETSQEETFFDKVKNIFKNKFNQMGNDPKVKLLFSISNGKQLDLKTKLQLCKLNWNKIKCPDTYDYEKNDFVYSPLSDSNLMSSVLSFHCPVDIKITDKNNNTVLETKDEKVIAESNYANAIVCDGVKNIVIFNDEDYNITVKATDNGVMNYSVMKLDNEYDIEAVASYDKINLTKNDDYNGKLNNVVNEPVKDYQLTTKGKAVESESTGAFADEFVPVTSITLSETELKLNKGNTKTLTASINPENATVSAVTWMSSEPNVASVDEYGNITAVSKGQAEIICTSEFGTISSVCKVTVNSDNLLGDTNGDGKVNIADALMIARYDAKLTTLNDTQLSVSDVNGDSKVNIADALKIARYDAKLIDKL